MPGWLSWLKYRLGGSRKPIAEEQTEPVLAEIEPNPSLWPHWPAGSLPHSLRLPQVSLYRYQPKKYLQLGDTWYHMVWDLEHKWKAPNRYAGRDASPGHFFAVSPGGALAEINAYHSNISDYVLLRYKVSIDNLLDLTNRNTIKWFYEKHFLCDRDLHWALILDSFFDQQLGGDTFNQYAGHKALKDGYNGIVFFGARAIRPYWPAPGKLWFGFGMIGDPDYEYYIAHEVMRSDETCINVVIYFGHNVVRATHDILLDDSEVHNRLFSASIEDIDQVFASDPEKPHDADLTYESLRSRVDRMLYVGKSGLAWTGKGTPR